MATPRLRYPKGGLPAPPSVHVEVPALGQPETNLELEGLVNPIDSGVDLRVTLAPGAAPGISVDLSNILAAIVSKGADTADQLRANRSALESVLHELQHPKQVLYLGTTDVTLANGGAHSFLTPWIDTNLWRMIGYYIANTGGQNPITAHIVYWSEDPAGASPFYVNFATASGPAIATAIYSEDFAAPAANWQNTHFAPLLARYFRLSAASAIGTAARSAVLGMR